MLYEVKMQKLDYLMETLKEKMNLYINQKKTKYHTIMQSYIFKNPKVLYQEKEKQVMERAKQLQSTFKEYINERQHMLSLDINTLKLVNPLNILEKGYSLVMKDDKIMKSYKQLQVNDEISIRLKEGSIKASVKEVKKNGKNI